MKPSLSAMSLSSRPSLRRWPLLATLLLLSACYKPGRFVWVDDYREPQVTQQDDSYLIRKGDVLNVNVWNQRDISSRLRVRDDGRISLPLLNDVEAAGMTPAALARAMEQKLKDLVANPVVTVMVDMGGFMRRGPRRQGARWRPGACGGCAPGAPARAPRPCAPRR